MLQKSDQEILQDDNGEGSEIYGHMWAVLTDKGYQGAASFIRAIHPKENLRGGGLDLDDPTSLIG